MGNDSNYRSETQHSNGYEIVETIDPIATAAQHITSTYIEQIALVAITLRFDSETDAGSRAVPKLAPRTTKRLTQPDVKLAALEEKESRVKSLSWEQVVHYLLDHLRPLVRKTDKVFLLDHTSYFLLPGANQQGGQIVQSRLWEALLWHVNNITDAKAERVTEWHIPASAGPCTITVGHSAYPIPFVDMDEFIKAAGEVMLRFDQQPERTKRRKGESDGESDGNNHKRPRSGSGQHTSFPKVEKRSASSAEEGVNGELPTLARKLGIPYLSLLPRKLPADIQQLVDPKLAQELQCYPLGRERNMLTVAMLNPRDHSALERLHQETGLHIFPVLTHPDALQTVLDQLIC